MYHKTIIPAHDERVMVRIDVPVKGRKNPLKFIAPRFEFLPVDKARQFDDYVREIEDEEKKTGVQTPGPVVIMNYWFKNLDLKDADALLDLTVGEKLQIFEMWQESSKVTLGESDASSES